MKYFTALIYLSNLFLIGCNKTSEEKSVKNCEKYIRENKKIDAEIKLIHSEVFNVTEVKIDLSPYENAVYAVALEFDTYDEYKKFGDCVCDEDGNVIPENQKLEERMEREAE